VSLDYHNKRYNFDEIVERIGTDCVKWDIRNVIFGTEDVLPMWVADMDFKSPDFVADAIRKRAEYEIYGYSIRSENYYNSIISWVKKRHNWEIKKDWILFSPGVVPGLNATILALTQPGDKIIIQPPVYFPFFSVVLDQGRQLVQNPLKEENGSYKMDFDDLKKKIDKRCKMIVISNPHNPTGNVWSADGLREMAEICLKNNILILSDEIHCDLTFKQNIYTPVASISEEIANQTITFIAASKTFNLAGLASSSIIVSNKQLNKTLETYIENLHLNRGNIFGTIASEAAYTFGENWLNQLLEYVQGNINYVDNFLKNEIPVVKMIKPEATYMIWLDFRELNLKNENLKNFVIQKAKLGLNHGTSFGIEGEGFQRINVACSRKIVEDAMNRLKNAVINLK